MHSFIHPLAEGPLLFPHFYPLSRGPPWDADPGFELGPAVQQTDALLSELRRTLTELRRTLSELRRTLFMFYYFFPLDGFGGCLGPGS